MDALRIITVGNVDDGKSTLLGRLLYDSKVLFRDHIEELYRSSQKQGLELNLALLTDGLKAEREKGITIDVAYRFFSTANRKFVIMDAPGHLQYTRNMISGASNADVGLIVVDVIRANNEGIQEQTKRHLYLLSLLRVAHVFICVSKMDLVDYSQGEFDKAKSKLQTLVKTLGLSDVQFIPISSLEGENVVAQSGKMPWLRSPPLLEQLEKVPDQADEENSGFRFAVQGSLQFESGRAHTGIVLRGSVSVGDEVLRFPGSKKARISSIYQRPENINSCGPGDSVAIQMVPDLSLSRGEWLVSGPVTQGKELCAALCWFSDQMLTPGSSYLFRHGTREIPCQVSKITKRIDIRDFSESPSPGGLGANEIGEVEIRLAEPLLYDSYAKSKLTGSAILIDPDSNATVAALMLR